MRWVTFTTEHHSSPLCGILIGDVLHALPEETTLLDLLRTHGTDLEEPARSAAVHPYLTVPYEAATILSPIPNPPTIRDFYSFEQHVKTARKQRGLDMEPDWYNLPVFYFTNPYATTAPNADIPVPPGTHELDYELEVAAILGGGGTNLTPEEAQSLIAGYCIMNDWSARDIQRREMKLSMGPVKGKDFATTLGPWMTTPDELTDLVKGHSYDLTMTATVNGKEYSRASLADIYWSFPELISYASRGTVVKPGDVIGSGTCGTGCIYELSLVHGTTRYPWLKEGDVVTLSVDRLGSISNRIVRGPELHELRPQGVIHETA
ncbi:MAG: fumarylacetoacetate hydrolase family protein [Candidatus Dormibacteria bacterium]